MSPVPEPTKLEQAARKAAQLAAAIAKQPARAVACPSCKAPIGRPCMRPSGHQVFGGGVHAERFKLAQGGAS